MVSGVNGDARDLVVVRHRRVTVAVYQPERTGRRPEGDGAYASGREARHVAQHPGRTEQAPLARVGLGKADAVIFRVRREGLSMRVVAAADRAWADAVCGAADVAACCGDLVGQRLVRFHHRAVVGRVHDRAGSVVHEVQQIGRRALAVQLGKEREHATAEFHARKGGTRNAVQVRQRRRGRTPAAGQHGFEVADRADRHGRKLQPGCRHEGRHPLQFAAEVIDALDNDLQLASRTRLRTQLLVSLELALAVAQARVELADQQLGRGAHEKR